MKRKKNKAKCRVCKRVFTKGEAQDSSCVVCSCSCAVTYYETQKPKGRKLSRDVAKMVGRRSMAEVRFDANFLEGKCVRANYELDTFTYRVEETRKYTPDWTIIPLCGRPFYLEFKGVLDTRTRKKMKLVKAFNPKLDIRFVFENASNKIMKTSKTT